MPDEELLAWFKGGVAEHMEVLATAEGELTAVLQQAVAAPSLEHVGPIKGAADALTSAARGALSWLSQHPSSNAGVNAGTLQAWESYASAGRTIEKLVDGDLLMTPESGERARVAIERAQKESWEFAMTFAKTVGA